MQRLFYNSILKINNIEFKPKIFVTPLSIEIEGKLKFEKLSLKKRAIN